jgi:hypothetical protein
VFKVNVFVEIKKQKRVKQIPPLSPHPQVRKPVRKEKKLLLTDNLQAGCFSSFLTGMEFWFSKAEFLDHVVRIHTHPHLL